MKSVLISIQPKWCEMIASGQKTVEVRKTVPKLPTPFKVYIYCTQEKRMLTCFRPGEEWYGHKTEKFTSIRRVSPWSGKVIGEFVCDNIMRHCQMANADLAEQQSCVHRDKIFEYSGGKEVFGWHISDLVIYDDPKPLSDFHHCGVNYHFNPPITRPPQSWCYVEKAKDG